MKTNTLLVAVTTPIIIAMLFIACAILDLAAAGSVLSITASIAMLLTTVAFITLLSGLVVKANKVAPVYELNTNTTNNKAA